ncbi:polysaccharide pyruvyl transferase family protein [Methanococcoides seepicolus]|uniref:Polysaccharide pyruvyl transferase family protein n=1 Tax=Methanococcoides seepicolus TaxID=2828780 RepID=A0A9E4ZIH1_9EURY|nr:polysaccharide pyruvyl transferase family protein [Methanococcoides seepicolus]MCM1987578.1 polysaccharide pyruvyl transferase family protein [Methanococcoides seepicolus]
MTKILLLNVGWSNKGNLALIHSTMMTIENFIPDVEWNLLGPEKISKDDFVVKKRIAWGLSIRKPQYTIISLLYLIKCFYIYLLRKLNVEYSLATSSKLFDYYDCDLVINSGGDQMSGENGIGVLGNYVNILYAVLLGKPVVLYGESLGYFKSSTLNYITKLVFNKTQLIIVRENISEKYLVENGITDPKICVTSDPAFLLSPVSQDHVFNILSAEGINDIQRPLIGINPSGLINKFMEGEKQESAEKFIGIMAEVIDNLIDNLNAVIIMVPHVYSTGNDDRIVINRIFKSVKNKSKLLSIKNEHSPEELKGVIGLCDLFIGARMHATIASTSMLVPTVGIAYSHKMHGIIGEMLGQEKYIIDINDLDYTSLISKINDAWENKEKIKKELQAKIPIIKDKAMSNGKFVKELLDSS